jgi:hypothetical protein
MNTDTFSDLETRLRSDLPRLADTLMAADVVADPLDGDAVRSLEPSGSDGHRRRWLVPVMAVAAVLLVLLGVVLALRAGDDRDARPVDVGPAPVESGWAPMATSPLSAREAAVSVWTGTEVIVWGGRVGLMALSDGAAYNPATDTWRMITPNSWGHPGAHAVWTGTEMIVLAKNGGAAYNPVTDTWRDLPLRQSGSGSFLAPVWTGDQLIGVGVDVAANESGVSLTTSRLTADGSSWEDGGSTPLPYGVFQPLPDFSIVWTGTEAVAWDPGVSRGWAFAPLTGVWRDLPQVAGTISAGVEASIPVSGDGELSVVASVDGRGGSSLHSARLVGDTWTWATGISLPGRIDGVGSATAAGDRVLVLGHGLVPRWVDESTGDFSSVDGVELGGAGYTSSLVWTGEELVVWGGADGSGQVTADGWRWRPGG